MWWPTMSLRNSATWNSGCRVQFRRCWRRGRSDRSARRRRCIGASEAGAWPPSRECKPAWKCRPRPQRAPRWLWGHTKRQRPGDRGVASALQRCSGGATQSRTGLDGFAIRCITDLLSRRCRLTSRRGEPEPSILTKKGSMSFPFSKPGAGNETRTRDLNLGKVALYQLSYSRMVQLSDSNLDNVLR
jgi:hypothetical protein